MHIEFAGAARNVTGSKHLLHINGKKILLDCGLFQGHRAKADFLNRHFPYNASEIDVVILSHAHIDHAGALPLLVKQGFTGKIFCTHPTRDLCSIMLPDSAYIQEKDFEFAKKKSGNKALEPLYTQEDANETIKYLRSVAYDQTFFVSKGVRARFLEAGHVLGSAMVEILIDDEETGLHIRLGFSGDLGRKDLPILKDPAQLENLDVLITETTYGNRHHDDLIDIEDDVAREIKETVAKNGKIIVPAFAVGRTQEVLFVLRELQKKGKLPKLKIFIDSPLAQRATEVFQLHPQVFDSEMQVLLENGVDPFCECDGVEFTRSVEDSMAINDYKQSAIVISASGMCEAGRIKHHLRNQIGNPNNLLLSVGFMAQNTLGRKLIDGESPINIFGEPHNVNAKVVNFRAFSGHADQTGLLNFSEKAGGPKAIFMVHGEPIPMRDFRNELRKRGIVPADTKIVAPVPGSVWAIRDDFTWEKTMNREEITKTYCDLLECGPLDDLKEE